VLPDQTAVVLHVASPGKLTGNLNDALGAIGPLAAALGSQIEGQLAEMFQVASLDAIDRTAPALIAAFALAEESDPVAYLVQTKDEMKLRRAVLRAADGDMLQTEKRPDGFERASKGDRTWFFARRGDWVVYTAKEPVVKLLTFDRTKEKTFASLLTPRAAGVVGAGDISAIVNVGRLTTTFKTQLEDLRRQAIQGIETAGDDALGAGGLSPAVTRKLLVNLVNALADAAYDVQWAAGRLNFSAEGFAAEGVLGVKAGSPGDGLLAAHPASALDALGLLPGGAPAYYGVHVHFAQIAKWMEGWLPEALAGDATRRDAVQRTLQALGKAGLGQLAASFNMPVDPKSGYLASLLMQAKDTEAVRGLMRDYELLSGETSTEFLKATAEFQPKAETYKGHSVDLVTQKIHFDASANAELAILGEFFKRFFGGDSLQTRVTAVEGMVVQATGNDPKFLARLVDSLSSGEGVLGLEESFAKTRDRLGKDANFVVLLNVPQLIVEFVRTFRDIPPLDMVIGQLPFNFDAQPAASYAGLAIATESHGLSVHVFVPTAQPKSVLQIFGQGQ
jgi:hypothetical protein